MVVQVGQAVHTLIQVAVRQVMGVITTGTTDGTTDTTTGIGNC
jgi:hypothetical protein